MGSALLHLEPSARNPVMPEQFILKSHTTQRNLRRLFLFRSISLALQMLTIFAALRWLALPLPVIPLAAILITHTLWNGFTAWRAQQQRPVTDGEFFLQLLTDVLALSGVFYFTGGASNPFVGFYLLPLTIAATMLPSRFVWGMATIMVICYSLLMYVYLPLKNGSHMPHGASFNQHVFGMWFGFVLSAALVSYFVTNMAQALRERDRALAATREQSLRDGNLVALGTLAAGAAHELGTPLNTMAIVSDELRTEYAATENVELNNQLTIISDQIIRCKSALSVISASAGELRADSGKAVSVKSYLEDLILQWQKGRSNVEVQTTICNTQPVPLLIADLSLEQAINNILNNAADASPHWISIDAQWAENTLILKICDRGPGLSPQAKTRIGKTPYSDKEHGLGLGLYLAHSVIQRLGGDVRLLNTAQGNCTQIRLPLLKKPV